MSEAADMHPDDVNGRDGPEAPGEDRARELATLNTRLLDEIAKRKRTEEALRKSEERYREIFDEAPGALWVEDWSRVKRMIDRLAEEGVEDLRAYFAENRERIVEAYDRAEFIQASNANREFFGASSIDELEYASKGATVLPEELDAFLDVLFTFIDARWSGGVESVDDKMDGTPIIIHTEYVMPPSHRHD